MQSTPRWLHIFRITLLVLIIIGIFLLATYRYWIVQAGEEALLISVRGNQNLKTIPIEISVPTDPILDNAQYSFEGISFSTPWKNGAPQKGTRTLVVRFPDTKAALVIGKATEIYTLTVGTSTEMKDILSSYSNNYDYYRAITKITPSDIHPFTLDKIKLRELIVNNTLLVQKHIIFSSYGNPVYSFDTKSGIHVFEFTKSATTTTATLFTPDDRQFDFMIIGATKAESNSILESLEYR